MIRAVIALVLCCAAARAQIPVVTTAPTDMATLRYIEIAKGTGLVAAAGKRVKVHYTGWLPDGTKFDSSVDRNEPFNLILGRKQVIIGWDVGLEGMQAGGKRRLLIPSQFAYGAKGSGPIPADSPLVFDVEMLEVTEAPTVAPAIDLIVPFGDLATRTLNLANAIPDAKLNFRPVPAARSFIEILSDMADAADWQLRVAEDDTKPGEAAPVPAKGPLPKADVLKRLETNFGTMHKDFEAMRNGMLLGEAELAGKPVTRRAVLAALK